MRIIPQVITILFLSQIPLISQSLFALSSPPIYLNEEILDRQEPLGKYLLTASDEKAEMDVKSIMRGDHDDAFESHGDKKVVAYGYSRRWPHWGYLEIINPKPTKHKIYLEAGYSAIDKLTVHSVTLDGEIISKQSLGDKLPFSERPIQYRNPVFELNLAPGSNYFLVKIDTSSGVTFDFKLYDDARFKNTKLRELITVGLLLGGILTILFYNLFLYITTGDKNYGLYVIYVSSYFVFSLFYYGISPYFIFTTWENAPLTGWDLYSVIDIIAVGASLFAIGFLGLRRGSPVFFWLLTVSAVTAGLNATVNILFLHGKIHQLMSLTLLLSFVMGLVLVSAGIRMVMKGYKPAIYFTVAWTFVITGNCLVLLAGSGVIEQSFITTWGQLIGANAEMIFLSFALGARINLIKREKLHAERQMLRESEEKKKLQAELISTQEENIRTLDGKVKERTRAIREILTHINQGIFTFREDMKLGPEFSDYLTQLVGKHQLAGLELKDAIFANTNLSANQLSQTTTALEFSFGEDREFGWEANRESLVREFEIIDSKKHMYIEADWGAIENDTGEIEKVLVSLRDVTEIKELKARAEEKEREAAMLLEMISVDIDKTQKFLERTLRDWRDIDEGLSSYLNDQKKSYANLFRIYHTIKGNARSLGFVKISDFVHDVESVLKDLGTSYSDDNLESLRHLSNNCQDFIKNYQLVFDEKFSKFLGKSKQPDKRLFESYFEEVIFPSISSVAKDVGKPKPAVNINNPDHFFIINDEIEEIGQTILIHLIRNSMDHGIEEAEKRKALGKKSYGEINIDISIDSDSNACFRYSDDGRGLNLSKIYRLGREKGLLDENATAKDIIETIFNVGFSTAQMATHISGRGIGMDAIRYYSRSLDAELSIHLDEEIDELTLRRIKSEGDLDIYDTFHFRFETNLKSSYLRENPLDATKIAKPS